MSFRKDEVVVKSADDWGVENDKKAKANPASGRVDLIFWVDQPDTEPGVEIQLRKLFCLVDEFNFVLVAEGEGDDAGTMVRFSGDPVEAGKTYDLGGGLTDMSARFERSGVATYPRTEAKGTLTIRAIDSESVSGSFRFSFSNSGVEDRRSIDVYSKNFVIKY